MRGDGASIELPGKSHLLLPTARGRNFRNEQGFSLLFRKSELPGASSPCTLKSKRSGVEMTFLITSLLILDSPPWVILGSMNSVKNLT